MKLQVIYVIFLVIFSSSFAFKLEINNCQTKASRRGICREKIECVGVKEPLLRGNCPKNYVCCPKRAISRKKCYEYSKAVFEKENVYSMVGWQEERIIDHCGINAVPLIVGGKKAAIKEFPHMAALGFRETPSSNISWACGGSLISELYIVTAAHCIQKDKLKNYVLKLGGVSLSSKNKYVQLRGIKNVIFHPRYNRRSKLNDIALLRMNKEVKYTPFVRPICLDYGGHIVQDKVLAIGYGIINYDNESRSDNLLKVTLDIIDKKTCSKSWGNHLRDNTLCAGSVEPGRDTCSGDSGGPIQVISKKPYCMYRLLALTSKGRPCGFKNSFNIYTRAFWFVPWIESVVWPGEN